MWGREDISPLFLSSALDGVGSLLHVPASLLSVTEPTIPTGLWAGWPAPRAGLDAAERRGISLKPAAHQFTDRAIPTPMPHTDDLCKPFHIPGKLLTYKVLVRSYISTRVLFLLTVTSSNCIKTTQLCFSRVRKFPLVYGGQADVDLGWCDCVHCCRRFISTGCLYICGLSDRMNGIRSDIPKTWTVG